MPQAPKLFSSLRMGRVRLRNRLVMEALPSGQLATHGFADQRLQTYYRARARGGCAALVIEAARATAPAHEMPHLGLYADAHIPNLRECVSAIRREECVALVMIDQPRSADDDLGTLAEAFTTAAWRAHATGADGIMLSTADNGPFSRLSEPIHGEARLTALLYTVESIVAWLGKRCLVGVRLSVEEGMLGGLSLQDARVAARRLGSAGAGLIEVTVRVGAHAMLAQFPGWCVPVAAAIKAVVDLPIAVGGQLDDPELAEQCLVEGAADMITVGERLRSEPRWPEQALKALRQDDGDDRL